VRLGIFGGSFDPPHVGHLLAAHDAADALSLDQVVFVPTAQQPLKATAYASAAQRLAMVQRLVGQESRFGVDPVETERPGLSFTVDTLRYFRSVRPEASLFLLLGADAAALLTKWREPEAVLALARLVVVERHEPVPLPRELEEMATRGAGAPIRLPERRVDVSSTEIRARVAKGLPVRGFVPDAVAEYLADTGLYADGTHLT
jgi:nicotinate-nucleotide adenylyltransferase